VVTAMEQHGVQRLIHGHTHRPAVHELQANDRLAQRYVTGDWHEQAWYIEAAPGKTPQLFSVSFSELGAQH